MSSGMGIRKNFDDDQNQSKNGVRPNYREKAKKSQSLPRHTIKDEKNSTPFKAHKKRNIVVLRSKRTISMILLYVMKMLT